MVLNWRKSERNLEQCFWKFGQCQVRVLRNDEKPQALILIMLAIFRRRDPIIAALRFDEVSIIALRIFIKMHLDQNVAYGCFQREEEGFTNLVAVDALYVRNLRDEIDPSEIIDAAKKIYQQSNGAPIEGQTSNQGKAFENWITYIKRVEKQIWAFGQGKICNILTSFGVFIANEVRHNREGRRTDEHIAEMLRNSLETMRNRKNLAKALRIEVVGAAFIGEKIQKAVEKDGVGKNKYKILYIFRRNDFKELGLGNISKEEKFKLMIAFPVLVMGLKQCVKRELTVAEARGPENKRMRLE